MNNHFHSAEWPRSIFCLFTVLLIVGCENAKEARVSGRVSLDGSPLDRGTVTFIAGSKTDAKAAAGGIQPDGSYQVQIGHSGKIWIGEYSVMVSAREPSIPHPEGGPPTPGALITPERYANTNTSGLRYNIRPGGNIIDIALVSEDPAAVVEPVVQPVDTKEPDDEKADAFGTGVSEDAAEETSAEVTNQDSETTFEESEDASEENAEVPAE